MKPVKQANRFSRIHQKNKSMKLQRNEKNPTILSRLLRIILAERVQLLKDSNNSIIIDAVFSQQLLQNKPSMTQIIIIIIIKEKKILTRRVKYPSNASLSAVTHRNNSPKQILLIKNYLQPSLLADLFLSSSSKD